MTTKDVLALALESLEKLWLLSDQAGAIAGPAITAIKQAITPETGNAATSLASAITACNGQAHEPMAWEATTPGYIKYVTDKQYRSYCETAKRWYKPYKCSSCTAPKALAPLSRDDVKRICAEADYTHESAQSKADFINGIRHGEKAHGIGGTP